jgi:hypothetical protein
MRQLIPMRDNRLGLARTLSLLRSWPSINVVSFMNWLKAKEMRLFRPPGICWSVSLLTPSFLYEVTCATTCEFFRTVEDASIFLGHKVLATFLFPLLGRCAVLSVMRFLVLAPLGCFAPA